MNILCTKLIQLKFKLVKIKSNKFLTSLIITKMYKNSHLHVIQSICTSILKP